MDWLRGVDLNHRPLGYEPNELPDCSTPHIYPTVPSAHGQISVTISTLSPTRPQTASASRFQTFSTRFAPAARILIF